MDLVHLADWVAVDKGGLAPRRADGACADCPKPYALGRDLRANVALTSTTLAFSQTALLS